MTLAPFSPQSRDLLTKVSTATLATALFKQGFRNVFLVLGLLACAVFVAGLFFPSRQRMAAAQASA